MKDVAMAAELGVSNAWAQYGGAQHTSGYDLLREVTHWTEADVEKEKQILKQPKPPEIVLKESFSEILNYFEFGVENGF
jgi:hypothetical protein